MIENLTVVVRGIGERTQDLCQSLVIAEGVPQENIELVSEVPFSKTLKRSLEIGLDRGGRWTLCLDADVLIRKGSIAELIARGEEQPEDMMVIQGLILDKFFGILRPAGNRLYRTAHLSRLIKNIPQEGTSLKPETDMLQRTLETSKLWYRQCDVVIGLHDYEQFYIDIVRKACLHAHKHKTMLPMLEGYWLQQVAVDNDFRAALAGCALGKSTGAIRVSRDFLAREIQQQFQSTGLSEKQGSANVTFDDMQRAIIAHDLPSKDTMLDHLQGALFPRTRWNEVKKTERRSVMRKLIDMFKS